MCDGKCLRGQLHKEASSSDVDDSKPRRVITLDHLLSVSPEELIMRSHYDEFTLAAAEDAGEAAAGAAGVGLRGLLNALAAYMPELARIDGVVSERALAATARERHTHGAQGEV